MADKNQALINYLLTCQPIKNSVLYFNFINAKNGATQFVTIGSDASLNASYVDGAVRKRYSLTIISYLSITDNPIVKITDYNNENVSDIAEVQALIDWIAQQDTLRNYPDFGTNCIIDSIQTTTNNPRLDQINATVNPPLAKYSFTITVDYIDTSKRIWT